MTQVRVTDEDRTGTAWRYRLLDDFAYDREFADAVERIIVPAGFTFDGASIPRAAWSAVGLTPGGPILAAATVHDLLYRFDGKLPSGCLLERDYGDEWRELDYTFTRKEADAIFREIMRTTGAFRGLQIWAAHAAVRVFGRRW